MTMQGLTGSKSELDPQKWHALHPEEVVASLKGDRSTGLGDEEASGRLERHGPNTLIAEKKEPFWKEFFEELREPMVLMLLVTGGLYALWGELADAITIFVIILTLNTVEVLNEQRSKKAIASLHKLAEPATAVRRDGHFQEIPVEQVAPGDLVMLRDGHRVPADASESWRSLYEGLDWGIPPDYFFHKGGLAQLTRFAASRLGPRGVRVNAVIPVTKTDVTAVVRWYPGSTLSPVDLFGDRSDMLSKGTNFVIRQPIPLPEFMGSTRRWEALVDVRNLFDQSLQKIQTSDGDLILTRNPRSLRFGLNLNLY